jgi:ArsR family metal-binding transcriptional regulator
MYLDSIALTRTLPCLAEPGKIIVIGKPNRSLDEVLPYLATLPGIIAYNPDARTLTFRRPAGFMTLYVDRVYITQLRNADEGLELLAALKDAINATWDQREQLMAVTQARHAPRPLDVWTLLPQTNCRQCGEATCMAFAVGLLQHKRSVIRCLTLQLTRP